MSEMLDQLYECIAELYQSRYGRLAPGKDDRLHDSSSMENIEQYVAWLNNRAVFDACRKIIELEQHIAEMQEVTE